MSAPTSSSETPTPQPKSKPSKARRIFRFISRFLLVVLILLIVASGIGYYLIWQPSVQQKLLQQFTSKMSKEWNVAFRIDSMSMTDFGHYEFYNFYLEDPDQDTLLYAGLVEAKQVDLWEIWENKRIDIGFATVKDAVFKVQRTARKRYFSLDYIIDYFHEEEPAPADERAKLSIDTAFVENVRYEYADASNGIEMTVIAKQVYASGHDVDLIQKRALLDTASLANSKVFIRLKNPIAIPDSVPPSPYSTLPEGQAPAWNLSSTHIIVEDMVYRSSEPLGKQAQHHEAVQQDKKGKGEVAAFRKQQGLGTPKKAQADKNKQLAAHDHQENENLTNLHVRNLRLRLDSFSLHQGRYKGDIKRFSATMPSGFALQSFRGEFDVNPERAILRHFRLETKESSFGNAVVLHYDGYGDLKDFMEKVEVSFNLSDCHFSFAEVAVFAPSLLDNFLIKMNKNTIINVSGEYHGLMKYFELTDIDVQLGKNVTMDKAQAAKDTPVEWLIKVFGPKNKERQQRERAAHKAALEEKREDRREARQEKREEHQKALKAKRAAQ